MTEPSLDLQRLDPGSEPGLWSDPSWRNETEQNQNRLDFQSIYYGMFLLGHDSVRVAHDIIKIQQHALSVSHWFCWFRVGPRHLKVKSSDKF